MRCFDRARDASEAGIGPPVVMFCHSRWQLLDGAWSVLSRLRPSNVPKRFGSESGGADYQDKNT